nr:unnamed protein product [Trichobilharzia regenti]
MENLVFDDPINEARYWKQKAEEYHNGMQDARNELDDFQTSSRELEKELETHLEQLEKRNIELVVLCEKLTMEKERYRNQVENNQEYANHEITRLQEELEKSKVDRDRMRRYIRELEQANDDLERAKRATVVTLEDFESRLNQAIERNAFLENELCEKEDLVVTVQRLKDETRDLHQELAITRRQPDSIPHHEISDGDGAHPKKTNAKSTQDCTVQTDNSCFYNSALTPSVRLAALNLVNNALQKITQLEMKLSILYKTYSNLPSVPIKLPSDGFNSTLHSLKSPQKLSTPSWTNGPIQLDPPSVDQSPRKNPEQMLLD